MSHKKYRPESNCLNCGAEVKGKFCSACGQENIDTRESFFHMVFHFVSDYFHFDSKFFRSLIPLFTKPGFLTKEYWEGRRAKYIHPLRVFFFSTIIFVIATSSFYKRFGNEFRTKVVHGDTTLAKYDSAYLASLPPNTKLYVPSEKDSLTVQQIRDEKVAEARQLGKFKVSLDKVFSNLKYITFLLLPIYAIYFRLAYRKQRPYYVDHLIYSMHLMTFMYCLFSVTLFLPLLPFISLTLMRQISVLIILVYIGFSMHYLYRQAWWKTILKSLIVTFVLAFTTVIAIMGPAIIDAVFLQ
jgi:hypothetical protein